MHYLAEFYSGPLRLSSPCFASFHALFGRVFELNYYFLECVSPVVGFIYLLVSCCHGCDVVSSNFISNSPLSSFSCSDAELFRRSYWFMFFDNTG